MTDEIGLKWMSGWFLTVGMSAFLAAFGLSSAGAQTSPSPPSPLASPLTPVPTPVPDPTPEKLALSDDGVSRLTIPVMIDGQGPFPFVIDTGADRTVISQELATLLNLPQGPHVLLHEAAGVDDVSTVVIERLDVGKRSVQNINAPVLTSANLGAAGLLGIDSLRDQHVTLDFKDQKLLSTASRTEVIDPFTVVVRGKSRFGQLVLVDAMVRGVNVFVIVDSGAQNTVGNLALMRLLTHNEPRHNHPPGDIISVTGRKAKAEFEDIAEMKVGGLTIRNMPLAFADLHTFDRFGLAKQPAMLLGMDVLGLCQQVTVDFKRREATFTLN